MNLRHQFRELQELGMSGTLYRIRREVGHRIGMPRVTDRAVKTEVEHVAEVDRATLLARWRGLAPFTSPAEVRDVMADRMTSTDRARLRTIATEARAGRILAFGRWTADYGDPIDWYRNPRNGVRWNPSQHWASAGGEESRVGDVKLSWEAARFPQAFHLARSAAMGDDPGENAAALGRQIRSFVANAPFPYGIHWNSGQEIAVRWMAWLFGLSAFDSLGAEIGPLLRLLSTHAAFSGAHMLAHFDYVRRAVYNNHLLTEALGLWLLGSFLEVDAWKEAGRAELDREVDRQVYEDGAYIQHSHNYHRVALNTYLLAWRLLEHSGQVPPAAWRRALERSLDFLFAQQNPGDGRLPNYGSNDGADILPLSTCDFADFRPQLQTTSLLVRGERLYDRGPWDEHAAWLLGARALSAPLRPPPRTSVAFEASGYYALRAVDPESFATFRCGSLRERFTQIDMLHLDVWWRGLNVLVDGGSYQYNGDDQAWHEHFLGTGSHNTVDVDRLGQMVHYRRFKVLYWTMARTLRFDVDGEHALVVGEHDGFKRENLGICHRRSVCAFPEGAWIVVDRIEGSEKHDVRLHWLCGDFPYELAAEPHLLLRTPRGDFHLAWDGASATVLSATVARGQEHPPRGWQSRYYGERTPTPSLALSGRVQLPLTIVTAMGSARPRITGAGNIWKLEIGERRANVLLDDLGTIRDVLA